jgi:hypothetical protein
MVRCGILATKGIVRVGINWTHISLLILISSRSAGDGSRMTMSNGREYPDSTKKKGTKMRVVRRKTKKRLILTTTLQLMQTMMNNFSASCD